VGHTSLGAGHEQSVVGPGEREGLDGETDKLTVAYLGLAVFKTLKSVASSFWNFLYQQPQIYTESTPFFILKPAWW
jgi:hypothetical protein